MRLAVYHNLTSGGAKRTLYERVKRLSGQHRIDVYSLDSADHGFCDLRPFVDEHRTYPFAPRRLFDSPFGRLNQLQRWRDLRALAELGQRIAAEIDGRRYDAVLVEPCRWTQAPALLRFLKTPSVYYCHEPLRAVYEPAPQVGGRRASVRAAANRVDPLLVGYRRAARQADRQACRAATRVLVNSHFMRGSVARLYGVDPSICSHGVDSDIFRPAPGLARQDYVLSVGAILPHKGFEFLIASLGHLPASARPALKLVGNATSAEYAASLHRTAARLGVALEIDVGLSQSSLVRRYAQAALFVYAAYAEPFGLAPLEAMACGTPVVAVADGGVRETVVHGQTGFTVERDPARFAQAMRCLLETDRLRAELGRRAREHILQHWTWDSAVAGFEQHVRAAAAGRAPALA